MASFVRLLIAVIALGMSAAAAPAQTYPSRPIKLIVPFPPGGPVDVMARVVAQRLSGGLGQVIVDNRPGAGGTLGSRAAAMAEPDGYTLLFGSSTTLAAGPALYRNPGYDPVKSFVPVGMISAVPFVLAIAPHVPARTLGAFVAYAKANPGKVNFGAPTGTLPHLTGEMLKMRAGIDIVHIPYRGAATAITDMLSGEMDMTFEPISVMVGHVREGKVIPLAVTGAARSPELPDVPTMIESGYPGFVSMSWTGIVAPAGTPPDVVAKLNRAVIDGFNSKEAAESLARLGAEPKFGTPESFGAVIAAEIPIWAETVRAAGVRLD
ncbi:MAG TPA: tripartite tricarboxylate transporter substrate binding protein [Xanthobacteraceae bacterium]|nr:tripartite tricarboxylate transporter substrate binding protein [Xanthobacteraceae bacterium]